MLNELGSLRSMGSSTRDKSEFRILKDGPPSKGVWYIFHLCVSVKLRITLNIRVLTQHRYPVTESVLSSSLFTF
ncbi:hypothetical protein BpHYR1_030199 [Brachionus plicatilis]|uniref:Uncharacterized protein n=1 Tax=Brachionus plicatilis TaxID=10195 RepID=A0A3M7RMS2_BRAPC|nr:hypothetical protein BpHYR1_030199 [Brachionus plicatilis]